MALIEYNNVEVLRKELVVLKGVSFAVEPGQMIYLIGKVGSGKSSLLKTMYAEVPVASGEARIFDYDLTALRRRDIPYLRRRIGIVFQDFRLLSDRNVYANLDFVLSATGWRDAREREERIDEVLRAVDMADKSYKMPHELSGGEQQRVVIARALLNRPELILADEPTGNLDPATGARIVERLHSLTASTGAAVIMATHNLSLVDTYPGRVMRIENKRLVTE
ncbi:MAG: ATP-binding cassette domain-containing protein [Bacteroides sp.]|nr:ATP-binding cassette domain-containing protein [Bacteroides sp.]MCM1095948.1 ATP-binding cassette domain-containing protein [Terasakiella sp.]